MFKIGEIRELIRLLDETSVNELRIDTTEMKLHLKKAEVVMTAAPAVALPIEPVATVISPTAETVALSTAAQSSSANAVIATPVADANTVTIKSPMVGTFYRSPTPETGPFVDRGSVVNDKTVVCIVEAMKLMNEIEAEVSGEVVDVLAQNGQLVEYGQPLFVIKRS